MELTALPAAAEDAVFSELGSPIRGLQWNEDVFALPPGATRLATGSPVGVAAFRAGRCAWGVQFHPEVDGGALDGWHADYGGWLGEAGVSSGTHGPPTTATSAAQPELAERLSGAFAQVARRQRRIPAGATMRPRPAKPNRHQGPSPMHL